MPPTQAVALLEQLTNPTSSRALDRPGQRPGCRQQLLSSSSGSPAAAGAGGDAPTAAARDAGGLAGAILFAAMPAPGKATRNGAIPMFADGAGVVYKPSEVVVTCGLTWLCAGGLQEIRFDAATIDARLPWAVEAFFYTRDSALHEAVAAAAAFEATYPRHDARYAGRRSAVPVLRLNLNDWRTPFQPAFAPPPPPPVPSGPPPPPERPSVS